MTMTTKPRERITDDLPMVSGSFKASPEDFTVEEVPAYEPDGDGGHVYLWVQKRDASAGWTLRQLAAHFGVAKRDIGAAGNKDRYAVTRQWYSLPAHAIDEQRLGAMPGPINEQIEVLRVSKHNNKLRRGHLKGNLFEIVVRLEQDEPAAEALERAEAIAQAIVERGMPNYYGDQRFGRDERTLQLGYGLLRGDKEAEREVKRNRFLKRLSLNAVQSELFNRVLMARMQAGGLHEAWAGDVLKRCDSGGVFDIEAELEAETTARIEAREISVTGPMFGPKMRAPSGRMAELEAEILEQAELTVEDFAPFGRMCSGSRRPLLIWPERLDVRCGDAEHTLELRFFLPSGSYATVLLDEILGIDSDGEDSGR